MASVFRSSVRLGPFVQGWALVLLRDVWDVVRRETVHVSLWGS